MQQSGIPSINIATSILAASFSVAFLILIVGVVIRATRRHARLVMYDEQGSPVAIPPPLPSWGKVPTWWCHRVDIAGLALMSMIFVGFGLSAAAAADKSPENALTPSMLLSNIAVFAVLVAMVAGIVCWRVRPAAWLGLRWARWSLFFLIGPAVVLGMWVFLAVLSASGYIAWLEQVVGSSSQQDAVALLRESKDLLSVGLMAFSAAIVAPLAEEVIFRGYLYPVAKSISGIRTGVLFSALLFAACHGNVPLLLPLFVLGILLALAYEWTGSIWAAISIHFFFNSATVAMQLAMRAGALPDLPQP